MKNVLVVISSARENRAADNVFRQVNAVLDEFTDVQVSIADLKDLNIPNFNEPKNPSWDDFEIHNESAKKWSKMVQEANGVLILTPEYNHGMPGSLKNAIDWLYKEWQKKPVALIGYGWHGAPFARKHLVDILPHIGANLLPTQAGLTFKQEINLDGSSINEAAKNIIEPTIKELVESA
jgi:NAD(P)H-dependent FMN reductase